MKNASHASVIQMNGTVACFHNFTKMSLFLKDVLHKQSSKQMFLLGSKNSIY